MNNTNYNKNLIDLQDDTIEITNIIKTNNNNESIIEIHIQKSLVNSNKYCPHCGESNQRLQCRECGTELPITSTTCTKCGAAIRPHRACTECGNYKGKEVIQVSKKED